MSSIINISSALHRTPFPAQLQRCRQLLNTGEPVIYLHALGAALPQASNLILRLQKEFSVDVETYTGTVALTGDYLTLSLMCC